MAKHRRQETSTVTRTVAAASAVVAGATLLAPSAQAAEVRIPNTPIAAEIPGIENVPGIAAIPGIDQWIPSLAGQSSNVDVRAAVDAAKALPGVANLPTFNAFLDNVQAQHAPVAAAQQYSAPVVAPAPQISTGQRIVEIARTKIGAPYVYGAAGPSAFDCSGFTSWVYAQAGISIPRTSSAQAAAGTRVPLDQIQPGDIVAYYGGASHVGIYIGDGMIIDALNSGTPVGIRPLHMMPIHSVVRF
ncbi:C40 family peptidase [Corynebacterium aquatimens]|uniref:C40 family peptidase n=1 Tax=Corynebacterium TaxID=1716 RepID=UPI001F2A0E2E|nr:MULTISPECIES: C40 family peptidase [Corynebacterium]QYH19479.1 C40 family peptidase [Corynebacterium aquatimens]UIZ91594.1 C40 family peptidase [Corynebacterium sp. CNCTC7651]